jgi:hypothetical protein
MCLLVPSKRKRENGTKIPCNRVGVLLGQLSTELPQNPSFPAIHFSAACQETIGWTIYLAHSFRFFFQSLMFVLGLC